VLIYQLNKPKTEIALRNHHHHFQPQDKSDLQAIYSKLHSANKIVQNIINNQTQEPQKSKRFYKSRSPLCSSCFLTRHQLLSIVPNNPANLSPVPEESEYHLFSECPSTKPHIDNLEASLPLAFCKVSQPRTASGLMATEQHPHSHTSILVLARLHPRKPKTRC
jgi:hypothetical protein